MDGADEAPGIAAEVGQQGGVHRQR